jgi:hypothetical protein
MENLLLMDYGVQRMLLDRLDLQTPDLGAEYSREQVEILSFAALV